MLYHTLIPPFLARAIRLPPNSWLPQFMVSSDKVSEDALERELYLLRRMMAKRLVDEGLDWRRDMYFCSLSGRTIVYKGMTNANVSYSFAFASFVLILTLFMHSFFFFSYRLHFCGFAVREGYDLLWGQSLRHRGVFHRRLAYSLARFFRVFFLFSSTAYLVLVQHGTLTWWWTSTRTYRACLVCSRAHDAVLPLPPPRRYCTLSSSASVGDPVRGSVWRFGTQVFSYTHLNDTGHFLGGTEIPTTG